MIELLAGAVSEGIARMEHEAEVERRRVLLDRALAASPDSRTHKIAGEKREVTLLFADLRHSTELSASLEIDQSFELLGHVMDCLTAAVMSHDGMVIDYYGDGLAAMWNAPADQAEHVELACRAALRMLERLPDVAADWAGLLQTNLRLAIGIHTGMVQVGNAGSAKRMKYGPRGPNVHVASRIEAAAKEFNVPLVVTAAAAERLSNEFSTHRLCRVRLRGVDEPTDLFAVTPATIAGNLASAWDAYGTALVMFEQGELSRAAELLQTIDATNETVPSRFLAQHVENAINRRRRRRSTDSSGAANESIITLGQKS
jgi:adenylate cyclase